MTEAPIIHLKCARTGRVYRVLGFNKEANTITLTGAHGKFVERFRPVKEFEEMGYQRIVGPFEGMIQG